jgi:hypothetical protein
MTTPAAILVAVSVALGIVFLAFAAWVLIDVHSINRGRDE